MTVWTDRSQIFNRINFVFFADFVKCANVMDVDELLAAITISFQKIQATGLAVPPIVRDAS